MELQVNRKFKIPDRTGYFTDNENNVVQVEQTNNTKFLTLSSLIK